MSTNLAPAARREKPARLRGRDDASTIIAVQEQPFQPEQEYCVYCHAPAAGLCADCGARCCADCVELVMRFTSRRAVCTRCLATAPPRRGAGWRWVAACVALVGIALLAWGWTPSP